MMDVKYPDVQVKLIGENGNAMNLIAQVCKQLRKHYDWDIENAFIKEALAQASYDDLLALIQRTVVVL